MLCRKEKTDFFFRYLSTLEIFDDTVTHLIIETKKSDEVKGNIAIEITVIHPIPSAYIIGGHIIHTFFAYSDYRVNQIKLGCLMFILLLVLLRHRSARPIWVENQTIFEG